MPFKSRFGSGFPFDDSEDRGLRSRLDDLAQRHPELADHLNPDSWGRRRSSNSTASEDPFARFRNRSRFQEFGFPFDDFEDPAHFDRHQQQPSTHPQPSPHPEQPSSSEKVFEKPPHPKPSGDHKSTPTTSSDNAKKAPIQQSNTVDLGQPQEPLVDDTRTHRSMSAPPEHRNRATGKRYVSSINIPNVNADMGGATSQEKPAAAGSQSQNPKERIIPIHIEGRDEPVIPKNVHTPSQSANPNPQQGERIFGQRPSAFTQFVPPVPDQTPAHDDLQQQFELHKQQQQQKYQEQQQRQQHQEEENLEAPGEPIRKKLSSLELIQKIQSDVSELMSQVERFGGKPRDKSYLYLDEMLTRKMLLLDDIETGGQDTIRKARKEAIKCIQDTIKVLENKAQANEDQEKKANLALVPVEAAAGTVVEPPVADDSKEKAPESTELIVGGVSRSGSQVTAMDVDAVTEDAAGSNSAQADAQQDTTATAEKTGIEEAAEQAMEQQSTANESNESKEGGTEKKKVKKKAEKK